MTILEMIIELLKLHGVDGSKFDRIDVALATLYEVEMVEKEMTAPSPKAEKKRSEKKASIVEEHMGI